MKYRLVIIALFLLTGCATDPLYIVDENAIKKHGIIYAKKEYKNNEPFKHDTIIMPIGGIFIPFNLGEPYKSGPTYAYSLITNEGEKLTILSKFQNFETGQCVKVFLSEISPPGLAHGFDCNNLDSSPQTN